ncbi:MAG: sodium:solute symporter family protein [Candidatus Brocadiia bacterium]
MNPLYSWIAVIVYSLLMVYIGYVIMKRPGKAQSADSKTGFEFWIAQRNLPGYRIGFSIAAGWLMLGWIGFGMSQIYMYGAAGMWLLPIPWFILCFIIVAMVPLVRRIPAVSLPQAIEQRFGISARALIAILSFGVFIAWTQAELFMAGTLMAPFLGVDTWVAMLVFVIPVILYSAMGGYRAIVTTDFVQMLLMMPFMIALTAVAIYLASEKSGGDIIGAVSKAVPPWSGEGQVFNLGFLGWVIFPLVLLIGYLPGWMIEQDLIIRLQSAKSTSEARKGAWIGFGLITVFIIILPVIIAFCALVVFPPVNGAPPEAIGSNAYSIISAFIAQLPVLGAVLMLVGIVACQMSTVDTFTNVSALALSYDFVEPVVCKRKLTEKSKLALARIVTAVTIVVGFLCAVISNTLGDVYYISSGVLSASIAVPVFFIFWKRTTLPAVIAASVAGTIATIAMYFYEYKYLSTDANAAHYYCNVLPSWLQGLYGYNYIAIGVLLSAIVIVVVSLITKKPTQLQLDAVKAAPVDDQADFRKEAGV